MSALIIPSGMRDVNLQSLAGQGGKISCAVIELTPTSTLDRARALEALIHDEPDAGQIFEPVDYEVMAALWRNPETQSKALAMADADRRQHAQHRNR